jgi:hypothetical protein
LLLIEIVRFGDEGLAADHFRFKSCP